MEKSEAWYGATLATIRKINPEAVLRYMVEAGDGNPAEETINKISRAFGIGTGDVWQIIRHNGLIERLEEIMFEKKVDDNEAMKLYQKGYSDNKIAEICGVKGPAIFAWRKKRELPPNIAPACPGSRTQMKAQGKLAAPQDHEKTRKLIDEVKKEIGIHDQNMQLKKKVRELELDNARLKAYMDGVKDTLDAIKKGGFRNVG